MGTLVGPIAQPLGLPGGSSAMLDITAAQVVKATPGVAVTLSVLVGGAITLNDSATTAGATTANEIFVGTALTPGQVIELNWPCAAGITASAVTTGTFAIAFS